MRDSTRGRVTTLQLVPDVGPGVTGTQLRQVLGEHAAGVVVITGAQGPVGLTVSSFGSLSLRPPLVSFAVAKTSRTGGRLLLAEHFAVNLLSSDQADVAARFARSDVDRFAAPTSWSTGPHGLPLLEGAAAQLICRQYDVVVAGDHAIIMGLVLEAWSAADKSPLLHQRGHFHRIGEKVPMTEDETAPAAGALG